MPRHATCATCGGFVVDPTAACIHCSARPRRFRSLVHHLATVVLGAAASVTLMACYAASSDYDCWNPEVQGCTDPWAPDATPGCNRDRPLCPLGERCDMDANACVPCEGAACGSCTGELLCVDEKPQCPEGTVPAILDGCWSGACLPAATCALEMCAPLDESACIAAEGCAPVYRGIDCTNPEGIPCTTPGTECTCASFEFLSCLPEAPM